MRRHPGMFFLIGCGLALLAPGCIQKQKPAFDITAMKKIIKEKNDQFTKAHITGDSTFLLNIFTQDARAFAPNADVVKGRAALAVVNSQYLNMEIKEFLEETTDFYGNEDYLIDEGSYHIRYGKDNTIDNGKYLNVWKKEDGDWKLYANIWNTNMPATPSN
jgi:ketosteroid isomerase-like protein